MSESGPYLGSKISLISQAKIRYEGCLYSISPEESTITLSNVRSFGTENRETTRHVPPGNEVYSLIIFKAGDIKDLHVCGLPKEAAESAGSNIAQDPAVLQHSGAVRSTTSGFQQGPPFGNTQGQFGSYGAMPYNQFGHVGGGIMTGQFGGQTSHPPPGLGRVTPPAMTRRSPTMEQGVQASGPISPQKGTQSSAKIATDKPQPQKSGKEEQGLPQRTPQQQQARRRGSREEKTAQRKDIQRQESRDKKAEASKAEKDSRERGERQERGDRGDRDKGGRGSQQGSRQNWQGYQGRRGRGRGPRSPVTKEKVGSDFDFTAAQFDKKSMEEEFKEKLKLDGTTVNGDAIKGTEDSGNETQPSDAPEEEETAYYDSTKSFFDNISCDSLNKGQRPSWKEERKMNCETFGIAYTRSRGRGGYRGGYYRGGYRGGRGQGRGGGRSYRSNRGRGGWKSQQGWNDYSIDGQPKNETSTGKTEKPSEATA
ncbi:protein LSM14 homolog A-like isoform X2 [Acanthaster planci]|uniref:Protein LSM14 homolog A-like isoform X2 n=1 Tax=Acanthaster planci TaxID=133434 RepID=A0A8B7ZCH5_ACAPL|nr:protein LSM14 homolog A-like isoform X2 [Acanthaster planci]